MPTREKLAIDINKKLSAVLARLDDDSINAAERQGLRRILDRLLDAREDLILDDLEIAAQKVTLATKELEKIVSETKVGTLGGNQAGTKANGDTAVPAGAADGKEDDSVVAANPVSPLLNLKTNIDFDGHIGSLGLRYFKPYEFLVKGSAHSNPNSAAYSLNSDPPKNLWSNIDRTARVLDEFRHRLKATVIITSAYRSPSYNKAIGGAKQSQHVEFCAIDFVVRGITTGPQDWATVLRDMRQSGMFSGGIGVYPSFVHVDTRGTNADWTG